MRVSGCNGHYKIVLGAAAKAKSMTNNLPILSVLGGRSIFIKIRIIRQYVKDGKIVGNLLVIMVMPDLGGTIMIIL